MNLNALSDFVLVASHGGFSQASRASNQPKATLSRRIRELEDELGVRLFDRDSRSLRLTDQGQMLLARTRGALSEISEAEAGLAADSGMPHGRLRVCAPVLFSEVGLGKIGAEYVKAYPAVQLELVATDRAVSPVEEGFDIVIRVNPRPTKELVGRCLVRERLHIVATPAVAKAARGKKAVVPSVVLPDRAESPWRVVVGGKVTELEHEPALRVSTLSMAYHAVIEGAGAGALPTFLIADDLASGRLVMLGDQADSDVAIWALYPSRRLNSRKVTSFLEQLVAAFPNTSWHAERVRKTRLKRPRG